MKYLRAKKNNNNKTISNPYHSRGQGKGRWVLVNYYTGFKFPFNFE